MAYEMTDDLDSEQTVTYICSSLHGKIQKNEEALLLLRVMEFCGSHGEKADGMFSTMAAQFHISDQQFADFADYVANRPSERVRLHQVEGFEGVIKTLLDSESGLLVFTYNGDDIVTLNDVPVLAGVYQVWQQSSVLKNAGGNRFTIPISSAHTIRIANRLRRWNSVVAISTSGSPTAIMACTI